MTEYLYIDCETIPSQSRVITEHILDGALVEPPDLSSIAADDPVKDSEKIVADIEKKRAKALDDHDAAVPKAMVAADKNYRELCFEGATAHVACVSFAFGDDPVEGFLNESMRTFDGRHRVPEFEDVLADEAAMLDRFFKRLRARIFEIAREGAVADWESMKAISDRDAWRDIGYGQIQRLPEDSEAWIDTETRRRVAIPIVVGHLVGFDIRMLWQRAKILGVTTPIWWPIDHHKYRLDEVQDTMTLWCVHDDRISLDDLCIALGIPRKGDGLDGSKVWDAIQAGRALEVQAYCDDDVERVRAVHKRIVRPEWDEVEEATTLSNDRVAMADAANAAADADHGLAEELAS